MESKSLKMKNTTELVIDKGQTAESSAICSKMMGELGEKCFDTTNASGTFGASIDGSISDMSDKIHASLGEASSRISEAIIQSNDKLTLTAIFFAVFVALIGALSAYLFNFLHWKIVRKTNKLYGSGVELIELIQRLESEALKYWISSYDDSKKEEILIAEISIKSIIRRIDVQTRALVTLLGDNRMKGKKQQISGFPYDIYDLVTGGDFESKARSSSKRKAMKISKQCSDARSNVSSIIMHI